MTDQENTYLTTYHPAMNRSGQLFRKIGIICILATSAIIFAAGFTLSYYVENRFIESQAESLVSQEKLIRELYKDHALLTGKELQTRTEMLSKMIHSRITLVNFEGKTAADSEFSFNELAGISSLAERREIQSAFKGESSYEIYTTETGRYMYVSMLIGNDNKQMVVRLGTSLKQASETGAAIRKYTVFTALLSAFLFYLISKTYLSDVHKRFEKILRGIHDFSSGAADIPIHIKGDDELNQLTESVNRLTFAMRDRIRVIESEKTMLSAVLDNMHEGVIAVDHAGHVLILNPKAEEIFDVTEDEALGSPLIESVQHPAIDEILKQASEERIPVNSEIELFHGKKKTIRISALGVDDFDAAIGCVMVLHDITEIRQVERVRKDFVANASHELRTPLTSIRGYVETLISGAYQDQGQALKFLKIINHDTVRLERLTEDLLLLSKAESKAARVEKIKFEADQAIIKATDSLARVFDERNISLVLDLKPDVHLFGNPDQFHQVILNLADNAVKFSSKDGTVSVRLQKTQQYAIIGVEDSGIGIPEEALPRIFERFYRVDKARSREAGGTGLGLSIVKHIIESAGGSVRVESRLGKGSHFIIRWPLSD